MPKRMRAPAARARQRGFLDFSISELAIIFGLALVVLGPKKLPGLVAQVGRWVGRARHMARQFREQLEQEVNSINAVKPIPRHVPPEGHVPPEVGPAAPATAEVHAEAAVAHEVHPESQIYFALNGTQPEVVAGNPLAAPPGPDAPQPASPDPAVAAETAPTAAPAEPASVQVIFPHDHG